MEKRIIKFRGMALEGVWCYGLLTILTTNNYSLGKGCYISNSVGAPFAYKIRPETVGQFTGLYDKNDKEIYEGDILRLEPLPFIDGDTEKLGTVEWDNNRAAFNISGQIQVHPNKNWEIIGNIYEHEHLLK